jgi:hypothetical protein
MCRGTYWGLSALSFLSGRPHAGIAANSMRAMNAIDLGESARQTIHYFTLIKAGKVEYSR